MKKRKNTIVSLVAAALAVCGLSAMAELVPSTRLPLPTEGLVFHGDAGETSSITTDAAGHVLEWRSMHGSVAFAAEDGQDPTNLPYYKPCINMPATAQVPGIVFGLEPGYEYVGDNGADVGHFVNTYLKSTSSFISKEVFMMMVNRPESAPATGATSTIQGTTHIPRNAYFFWIGGGRWTDPDGKLKYPAVYVQGDYIGKRWIYGRGFFGHNGMAWVNGELKLDWPNGNVNYHNNPKQGLIPCVEFHTQRLQLLDAVGDTARDFSGVFTLGLKTADGSLQRYFPQMDVCEIVIYDRVLTSEERLYVTRSIRDKWQNKIPYKTWTGAAGDGKWATPENWSGGTLPAADESVVIADSTVEIDADASCGVLFLKNSTVDIAVGKTLVAAYGLGPGIDAAVAGEGTLALSGVQADCGEVRLEGGAVKAMGEGVLPPSVTVKGGGTLDFNGFEQNLTNLVFDADGGGSLPTLDVSGVLDVSSVGLDFTGIENVDEISLRFLQATEITGASFESVKGIDGDQWVRLYGGAAYLRRRHAFSITVR